MDCIIEKKFVCLVLFIIMYDYKLKLNKLYCKFVIIVLFLEVEYGSLNFLNICFFVVLN